MKNNKLKQHRKLCNQILDQWGARDYSFPPPTLPSLIHDAVRICGAKTKATGRPCKRRDVYANGRCKYHGGLSSGPKTKEGKRKSSLNGFKKKNFN